MTPSASIIITTKNRIGELRIALASCMAQSPAVEVVVIDDGSTDGTAVAVQAEFPSVRLVRHDESRGLIVRRNELARLALAPVIVSIDDDASFPSPHTVEQTLRAFEHPRVGAVAIPFVNVNQDTIVRQCAPDSEGIWVADRFIGTAHALRRDLFVRLGGYREHFVHQGEEGDYCIRMLAAGYVVRLGTADPIHHYESPRRSFERMDYYGRRNDILFAWHNVPLPQILWHLPATSANGVRTAVRVGRYRRMMAGLVAGYWDAARTSYRLPVSRKIFQLFRQLKVSGPIRLGDIEASLSSTIPETFQVQSEDRESV